MTMLEGQTRVLLHFLHLAISAHSPDLVLLDVQMPELDGFAVIEAIGGSRMPAVIFVTAFDQHAVRAFDAQALDYVLKPIDPERFRRAVQRARSYLTHPHLAHPDDGFVRRVSEALKSIDRGELQRYPVRLAIRSEGRVRLLDIGEVDRIVAAGNYVEVHTGAKHHLLRETMASLESRLDPQRFIRVSRAAIVSIAQIREVQPLFNGDFVVLWNSTSRSPAGCTRKVSIRLVCHSSPRAVALRSQLN